ncbi:MAG TPA: hypothetical protein PKA27_11410 [Fimbriimonadaceae bacterium]|nr:hypothetical protein [Fimbriimonadaceae bacterium]
MFELEGWSLVAPRGVPFIRGIRSEEDARKYGVGPTNLVPFNETEYFVLREECLRTDPVLWAHAYSMWDNRLLTAIQECQRLEAIIFSNALRRRQDADKHNAPRVVRLESLVDEEAELRSLTRKALIESTKNVPNNVAKLAEALGATGLEMSGDVPTLEIPDTRLLRSDAAHAAELQLPHDPEEAKHFLPPWVYWAATGVTGCLFGISAFSVPGIVHPAALAKDSPAMVAFAMVCGVGFTTLAGRAMRLNFRYAAESCYLGKKRWWGSLVSAVAVNLTLAALYTIVDAIGLMKSSGVMAQITSLNGAKTAATTVDPAYIIAAGAFSITYTAYCSISGWMQARQSAANRITKAKEDERIEATKEFQSRDGFPNAVAALNTLRADNVAASQIEAIHNLALNQLAKEREVLVSQLVTPVDCTDDEALLLERARTEAEGRQREFDELMMTLREELTAASAGGEGQGKARRESSRKDGSNGLASWLKGAISRITGTGSKAT